MTMEIWIYLKNQQYQMSLQQPNHHLTSRQYHLGKLQVNGHGPIRSRMLSSRCVQLLSRNQQQRLVSYWDREHRDYSQLRSNIVSRHKRPHQTTTDDDDQQDRPIDDDDNDDWTPATVIKKGGKGSRNVNKRVAKMQFPPVEHVNSFGNLTISNRFTTLRNRNAHDGQNLVIRDYLYLCFFH